MTITVQQKEENLCRDLRELPGAAVAFSGGVDSAYLLYALTLSSVNACAYFVKTAFQPEFELKDAETLACQLGVRLRVLTPEIFTDEIICNDGQRCYYCKKRIFENIITAAKEDGFSMVLDGTNADDNADDRPGMQALAEYGVRSPLRKASLTKRDIRELSKAAGLFTWDKSTYSCLATRIPAHTPITPGLLQRVEEAENVLYSMGYTDLRVRATEPAKIELHRSQTQRALGEADEIRRSLAPYFRSVVIDKTGRSGI